MNRRGGQQEGGRGVTLFFAGVGRGGRGRGGPATAGGFPLWMAVAEGLQYRNGVNEGMRERQELQWSE